MPFLQFFIFFAWLSFGRMAVNPFGEDDTDIDLDFLLESHVEVINCSFILSYTLQILAVYF